MIDPTDNPSADLPSTLLAFYIDESGEQEWKILASNKTTRLALVKFAEVVLKNINIEFERELNQHAVA